MDFRTEHNTLDTSKRKRELRAELEKAMLEYKGKITVFPFGQSAVPVNNHSLNKQIAKILTQKKMNTSELSKLLRVSENLVARILRHDFTVGERTLNRLCKKLGIENNE